MSLVEDDDGVRAAVEHVHPVLRVARHARDLDERPALRQPLSALEDFVLDAVFSRSHLYPFR